MKGHGSADDKSGDDLLTEKQRLVLDLLIENKTSKEIARELGISPYTVDQRISLARGKLGVASRSELATRYRAMRERPSPPALTLVEATSRQPEPDHADRLKQARPHSAGAPSRADEQLQSHQKIEPSSPAIDRNLCPTDPELDHRVGPRVFEGSSGALWRVGAIVATALLLVMTILGLFAIFDQLNKLLA